ncbi:hypothetical protein BV898_14738 [Hypsibius exemplaris]|uniref:Ubiquitin-like domain-containing protein n=1 Tax=Hypsibius exemplaris TaxID=2072580 RepID=A0A9X6NCQ1_HYPEX|nr:hypothetical protein BV898_14738 [Hypsibius exemplaris]
MWILIQTPISGCGPFRLDVDPNETIRTVERRIAYLIPNIRVENYQLTSQGKRLNETLSDYGILQDGAIVHLNLRFELPTGQPQRHRHRHHRTARERLPAEFQRNSTLSRSMKRREGSVLDVDVKDQDISNNFIYDVVQTCDKNEYGFDHFYRRANADGFG